MLFFNKAALEISGYSGEELMKMNFLDLVHPEYRDKVADNISKTLKGEPAGRSYEIKFVTRNGPEIWIEATDQMIEYEGKPTLMGTAMDITERKRAQEALRESEERFRSIVENSHVGILILDDASRVTYVNDRLLRIVAYERDQLLGSNFLDYLEGETRTDVERSYLSRQRGENPPSHYEIKFIRPDGNIRNIEVISSVMKDSQGRVNTMAQLLDVTGRKEAEAALVEEKDQVTLYSDILSHDISNLNQGIMGYFEIIEMDEDISEGCKRSVEKGLKLSVQISTLIADLRKLSGLEKEAPRLGPVNVVRSVISAMDVVRSTYVDTPIEVRNELEGTERMLLGDELMLDIFTNLLGNSVKHNDKELVELVIRERAMDDFHRIIIEDNGPGISNAHKTAVLGRARLGDTAMFRRGMGMTLVKRIVKNYGGRIWMEDRMVGDRVAGLRTVLELRYAPD